MPNIHPRQYHHTPYPSLFDPTSLFEEVRIWFFGVDGEMVVLGMAAQPTESPGEQGS